MAKSVQLTFIFRRRVALATIRRLLRLCIVVVVKQINFCKQRQLDQVQIQSPCLYCCIAIPFMHFLELPLLSFSIFIALK